MSRILRCRTFGKPTADSCCSVWTQPETATEGHYYKSALLQNNGNRLYLFRLIICIRNAIVIQ